MIKLIMSDMDGTLLDENGKLPDGFDAVMTELKKRNILFAPASGRQYYALRREFAKYVDDFVFMAENGTYVVYQDEELYTSTLRGDVVQEMLEIAAKVRGAHVVLCGKKSAYVVSEDAEFLELVNVYYDRYKLVENFSVVDDDILKVAICDLSEGGAESNSYPHFAGYADRLQISVSSEAWLDIMCRGVNKGVAAKAVQKHFGVRPEETMAFGDYMNDLQMMKAAYHSYAMENARDEVKAAARFMARSNRERGVLRVIEEKVLSR